MEHRARDGAGTGPRLCHAQQHPVDGDTQQRAERIGRGRQPSTPHDREPRIRVRAGLIGEGIRAADPEHGHQMDDVKQYIDRIHWLGDADREKIYAGNARQVFKLKL